MKYAKRMSEIKASEIRELLKLTEQPELFLKRMDEKHCSIPLRKALSRFGNGLLVE
jgi:hypothetical protein